MTTPLRVTTLDSPDALQVLAPEWSRLYRDSGAEIPFFTFDWVDSWWRYMRQDRPAIRDYLCVRTVRSADGLLVGVAPLMLTERPACGPVRIRCLQFIGADANMTEIRGMLVHPGFEQSAYQALSESLRGEPWDWIQWSGIREEAGEAPLADHLSPSVPSTPAFHLPLPETWEAFRNGLKRNIRESLRKCYNSLARDNHSFALRVHHEPDDVSAALERFLPLHSARAEDTAGSVRHGDVFRDAASRRFLFEIGRRFAEAGDMRVFELVIGGEVVASRLGFVCGTSLYLYYSGYLPEWGRYSVMTTTTAEAIKYAIGEGLKTVNLSTGRDVSKTRWGPTEVMYAAGVEVGPSFRSRLAYAVYERGFDLRRYAALRKVADRLTR